jgi:hypothetical protein
VHQLTPDTSELVILPGVDHVMAELGGQLDERLLTWMGSRLSL